MTQPGLEPGPLDPESGALTTRLLRLPLKTNKDDHKLPFGDFTTVTAVSLLLLLLLLLLLFALLKSSLNFK